MISKRPRLRLGVNIDHVATLRQLRGGTVNYPDILAARDFCVDAGADQITVHLRGDRRHIQESDLEKLSRDRKVLLNLEMAPTSEMISMAIKYHPDIVCLVPEKREELTTEGGLDVISQAAAIQKCVESMHKENIRVSLFIEPDSKQIIKSQELDADALEFHTGRFALEKTGVEKKRLESAFQEAYQAGMAVHAGHGLDYQNVVELLKNDFLQELNIGHSIVCRAVLVGLFQAVREMRMVIDQEAYK